MATVEVDVESEVARALRALQKFDQIATVEKHSPVRSRPMFLEALDALGRQLGLECTGVKEPYQVKLGPNRKGPKVWVIGYDHSGETCPIHEWLVESDHDEITEDEDE
jgi:hypothetical protein